VVGVLMPRGRAFHRAVVLAATVLAAQAGSAAGQVEQPLSARSIRPFPGALADPLAPRVSGALLVTNLFAAAAAPAERPPYTPGSPGQVASEVQGDMVLGGMLPLWRPVRHADGGVLVGLDVAGYGRFRLEFSGNDVVNAAGLLALPVEFAAGRWAGRFRFAHWSAHLGDQLIEEAGARRVDYSLELLEATGVYTPFSDARLYLGGGVPTRSALRRGSYPSVAAIRDRAEAHGGFEWVPLIGVEGGLRGVAAIDVRAAERTGWRVQTSAIVGVSFHRAGREFALHGRMARGPSSLGQYFLTDESYWALELLWRGLAQPAMQ
jgi:hypothetical protein